ncbi:MAG TPA: hypothetical protein VNO70_19120 [Blastocatellia bacterium]|nr:hypothetical protein [Blastocatellia bacterium]
MVSPGFNKSPRRRDPGARRRRFGLLLFTFFLFPFALSLAHEPITTKVRFNKEVIRILQRSCLDCHRPGGFAPFSLATYDEARPWAKAIKEEILEKRMPVWHAVKGYGEFANAPLLTQREIDLLVNWVEGGAPKGDDKDLPKEPLYSDDWPLGKPDLILKPEAARKVASDADETITLTLPTNLKQDRWMEAIDFKPGNRSVVYSATFYLDSQTLLGTWIPGQRSVALPDEAAWLLPAGSRITARIRYRGAGEAVTDLSAVGIYFAKLPPSRQVNIISITDANATIPAGAARHRLTASYTAREAAEAIAIRPYANPLMVSFQATAHRPDGTQEVLIWTRGYRFDWQPIYYHERPVPLPKGTRVEVIAYFDNSENNPHNPASPPKPARWADLSADPLCSLFVAAEIKSDVQVGK